MSDMKRGRGRPRREDADATILTLTRTLLRESGYRAFNVDVVSERTGIAKTTIYRRWPSKGALVAAAIAREPEPSTDPYAILRETADVLAMLAHPDADAIDVIRAVLEPRRALLQQALAQRADAAIVADALLGALVTRLLLTEEDLADTAASAVSQLL